MESGIELLVIERSNLVSGLHNISQKIVSILSLFLRSMKPFLLILIFTLSACHSSKKSSIQSLDILQATYQKYIPGESGGKGILFSIHFKKPKSGLDINSVIVDGEVLKFSFNLKEEMIKLECSKFYADPDRDPESGGDRAQFEAAPLFHASKHQAIIHYTLAGKEGSQIIQNFEELPMQMYP